MTATDNPSTATRRPDEQWLARATPEDPIEPDLPIVDAHIHFWQHHTGYGYFVEDLARDVAESGHSVEATMFVEARSMYRASGPEHLRCVGETEFAAGMGAIADSHTYTTCRAAAGIIAFADLRSGDLTRETVEAHIEIGNGRLRGIRQNAKWDPDPSARGPVSADGPGLYLDPAFGRGLDLITSMGLTFDASIFHPQIPDVTAMARSHPDASIVLIHTGSPLGHSSYTGRDTEVHSHWLAAMTDLATCPNVTVKLGGLLMSLGNFDFTTATTPPASEHLAELWRPYIEPCVELFGADRCMVASNFPVERAGIPYGVLWNAFKRITASCSPDEKAMLFGSTACRVYQLDEPVRS